MKSNSYVSILSFIIRELTLSNIFTAARIILVPFIVSSMIDHEWGRAFLLFSFAAFTDMIDGALARFLGQESALGAYLDPVADKLLLVSCYAALAFVDCSLFKIPTWFLILVLVKELILIFGTAYLALIQKVVTVKPTLLGKMTTVIQVCFIWLLFLCSFFGLPVIIINLFLSLIIVLTLGTLFQYALIGYKGLNNA